MKSKANKWFMASLGKTLLMVFCITAINISGEAAAQTDSTPYQIVNPFSPPPVRESDIIIPEHFDDELHCPNGTFPYDNCHAISTYEDCQSIHRYTCKPLNPLDPDLFNPLNPDLKPRRWSPLEDEGLPEEPGLY